jgi:hypothetical protein
MKPYLLVPVLCLVLTISPAHAGDVAAAEVLFQKGRAAMEGGDYETAGANFAESYHLDAAVGTVMNLAVCEEKLGMLAKSWEHWQHALRALSPNDRRRQFVEERIAALEADLPTLTIVVKVDNPQRIELERNGVALGQVAWGVAVPVDPGVHEVVVKSPGHRPRRYQIEVAKGEARSVEVTTGPKLPERISEPNQTSSRVTWAYVVGGMGLAGLGTALATGIMLQRTKDTVDENCLDNVCNAEGMRAVRNGKKQLAANTTGFIVAGVGLGTGATLLLWRSGKEKERSEAGIRVVSRGVALTYRSTF